MSLPYKAFQYSLKATFVAAFGSLLSFAPPQAQAQDLYWTTAGPEIMGAELDGSNVRVVHDGTGMAGSSVDIAVTADYVYWTDKEDVEGGGPGGGVWRSDRNGGNAALFISNPNASVNWAPQFIALDEANNKIYFSCFYTGLYSADLATGGNVTALGSDSVRTTGVGVRGSNELISVTAFDDGVIYSTNIANKTHEQIGWFSGHGGNYGLAYDSATDTAYLTGFNGNLYSYNISSFNEASLLSALGQPLGVKLSASKSHLVYVERAGNMISAYDIANPAESFPLVSGEGAHFGVAIWGDPLPPPPTPPADLPVVDTFETGTPGNSIVDQPTSDGKAAWRQIAKAAEATLNYQGEPGDVTYEPFTKDGEASVYLELDVDGTKNYNIKFEDVLLRGGRGDVDGVNALGTRVTLGARKTDDSDLGTYRIGQWHTTSGDNYTFRYGIHYVDPAGTTHIAPGNLEAQTVPVADVDAGDYSGSEILLSGLELRVRGSQQALFINGSQHGPWYDTQGTYDDRSEDRALVIHTYASDHNVTLMNPVFDGVAIEAPPEPPPAIAGWQKIDDFDDRNVGGIHEQDGWSTMGNFAEVIENPYGPGRVLRVSNGRASHLILIPEGETGTLFFRARPFGNDNFSFGTSRSELLSNFGVSAGQFAFRASGRLDIIDNASSPNHIKPVGEYDPHTWYDVWLVVNNASNTVRYYVRGGDYAAQTLLADEFGQTEFNHRSQAEGDILSFGFQGFGREPMLVDQIWINAIEEDLTDPSPTPQDTQPATHVGPLLAYEGFNYDTGSILHRDGGQGWIYGHFVYGADLQPQVTAPGFMWDDLEVVGNRLVVNNPGSTTGAVSFRWLDTNSIDPSLIDERGQVGSVGSTYVSVLAKGGDPTTSRFWGFGLFRGDQERIFLGKGGNETGGWHFREQSAPALNLVVTSLSLIDQHFLVIKLDQTAGKAYLFANPDLTAGEPDIATAEAELDLTSTIGNWGFNGIRVTGGETGFAVDEVRIGTTWDSVTPTGGGTTAGFTAWQEEHFGSESDPSIVGPDADPDGDSIENVIEYALGLDPLVASTAGLPVQALENIEGQDYLTLTFTRPIGLSDVNYNVGASGDLAGWVGAVFVSATDNGDGTEDVIYRHNDPITASSRAFLRLEVDLQ